MSKWVIFISTKDHCDLFLKDVIQIYNAKLEVDSWYSATTKNGNHLSISNDDQSEQVALEIIEFLPDSFLAKNVNKYFNVNVQYFNINGLIDFCHDFSDFPDAYICDDENLFTVKDYYAILKKTFPKKILISC